MKKIVKKIRGKKNQNLEFNKRNLESLLKTGEIKLYDLYNFCFYCENHFYFYCNEF